MAPKPDVHMIIKRSNTDPIPPKKPAIKRVHSELAQNEPLEKKKARTALPLHEQAENKNVLPAPLLNKQATLKRTRTDLAQQARGSAAPLIYLDAHYAQLSGDQAFSVGGKYACCGSSRESILVDMASDNLKPIFEECFKSLEDELAATQPSDDEEEPLSALPSSMSAKPFAAVSFDVDNPLPTLEHILHFVSVQFPRHYSAAELEKKVAHEVKSNCVPLEVLVQNKTGVCRHQALLVGYLLSQLLHQNTPESPAAVYRFRTNLIVFPLGDSPIHHPQSSPHAVTIYQDKNNHLYLLDATRRGKKGAEHGLAINLSHLNQKDRELLQRCYEPYNVNHFLQEIYARYLKPPEPSASSAPTPFNSLSF